MAREFGIAFTPHTWSNGFGVVANTHLTAGLGEAPFIEFPCDPPEWSLERRDYLLAEPFDQRDGWLQLSEAPGFGVTLDERSEEPTSELQSLMRISSAVFCLKKKT